MAALPLSNIILIHLNKSNTFSVMIQKPWSCVLKPENIKILKLQNRAHRNEASTSVSHPSWKNFSENFLKFTEIYLNHIWKIAYYHFVPLNQFWTHFSNIAELSEKSELFWICLKNLNCFENCWNSLNSICIVLKQSELFWILLKQSELF